MLIFCFGELAVLFIIVDFFNVIFIGKSAVSQLTKSFSDFMKLIRHRILKKPLS